MKKEYSKPEILFEDFSLSTNIAVGCEKIMGAAQFVCTVNYPGVGNIFIEGTCQVPVADGSAMGDGYCYHVPTEDKNMFTS